MYDDNDYDENILDIGVVGFSGTDFDEQEAKTALDDILDDIEAAYIETGEFETVRIVAGLTNLGIPKIAYESAEERGYETVGISAEEAREYELHDVDEIIWVGERFGDESKEFIDMIDIFVRIGGGKQSFAELEMAEEEDIGIYEYDFE